MSPVPQLVDTGDELSSTIYLDNTSHLIKSFVGNFVLLSLLMILIVSKINAVSVRNVFVQRLRSAGNAAQSAGS